MPPRLLAALVLTLLAVPVPAADARPGGDARPSIDGTTRVGKVLTGRPGGWTADRASWRWQWLRNGHPVAGATTRYHRLVPGDRGARLALRLTAAAADGHTATATSAPTARIAAGVQRVTTMPRVAGAPRWTQTLRARLGRWRPWPEKVFVRWLRDGKPIKGATGRRFTPGPDDVGHRIAVRVIGGRAGYAWRAVRSKPVRIGYRVPVRRRLTYHVETRGRITTSVADFRRLAQATYDDPRGWRNGGVHFRRVARGGDFTLVLAEAAWVPRFSSGCSSSWSCRVGRYVIINQERWKHATSSWNAAGGSRRDYRHMVVNHETGHWLGRGHASCPGRGRLAPVMMQQSKDLRGCRFNPFPTLGEL